MIYKINVFLLVGVTLITGRYLAQSIDAEYQVGTWQGFKSAAVSFTFDDGTPKQFSVAVPMFNEFNFQLTLFTVTNWSSANWTLFKSAANDGHEVASHTLSHPHLGALTNDQQTSEIKNSQDQIDTKISGQKCLTIAYPYCETGDLSITKKYYIAGRICSGSIERKSPTDMFNISSVVCGTQGSVKTIQDFNTKANSAVNSKGWVVFLLHGVNDDGGYSPVTGDVLRGALTYLDTNKTKFWVTSFGNVAKYIYERNCVSINELSKAEDKIILSVTDTLDNGIFNYPLSVRRVLPSDWISPEVTINGKIIESEIVEVSSIKYISFDVIPDEGEITISKSSSTGLNYELSPQNLKSELFQNFPNPFNPVTNINYLVENNSHVTLNIYDVLGREVETLVDKRLTPGRYTVQFDGSNLPGGLYFCNLKTDDYISTKKIIFLK
ncbi:MAG: T9SS C-terminal target domain-containing protein [Ignavibacteriales bacterium]|nr:MAG: T9SS C-terminal target domain-containing protein [Ignavibacteriales bacterium]